MTDDDINPFIRPLQIIVAAMAAGIIAFGIVVGVLVGVEVITDLAPELAGPLTVVVLALAVVYMPAFLVLRRVLVGQCRQRWQQSPSDEPQAQDFAQAFQTVTLVGAAAAEAVALFALVVVLVTGTWYGLFIAAAGLLAVLHRFPTPGSFRALVAEITGRPAA
jgi:hypothetical protein